MSADSIGYDSKGRLWRSRWAAIGAAVAVTFGAGGLAAVNAAGGEDSTTVLTDPVRVLDSRDPLNVGLAGPFASQVGQKLQITGSIPTTSGPKTVVPAGATGVLLNVTAVAPTANGFVSIRPGDATGTPSTSSLNVSAGQIVPNAVMVALPTSGADAGKIEITYDAFGVAGPTTDILIDVVGHTSSSTLAALQAEIDSKVTGGPITTSHGPYAWNNKNLSSPVSFFDVASTTGAEASGDGFIYYALTGPETRGGIEYTLKEVTYCIRSVSGGGSVRARIVSFAATASGVSTSDSTKIAPGCFTIAASSATRAGEAFNIYINTGGGAAARVVIGSMTATWDARADLPLVGPLTSEVSEPEEETTD